MLEGIGQRIEREILATDPDLQPFDLLGIGLTASECRPQQPTALLAKTPEAAQ